MGKNLDASQTAAAKHVADLLFEGNAKQVGLNLASDYLKMGQDRDKFNEFLKQVQTDNQGNKGTNLLPGLEFHDDLFGNLRVDMTTPGQFWFNGWRHKQEVFAAIRSNAPLKGEVGVNDFNGIETAVADPHSLADVDGKITVVATKDSFVMGLGGANIIAQAGSFVDAQDAVVRAKDGSVVAARPGAEVKAESGATIINYDDNQLKAAPGAKVMTGDQGSQLYKSTLKKHLHYF